VTKRILTNIFLSEEVFNEGFPVTLFEIIGCTTPKDAEKVANWFSAKFHRLPASHYSKDGRFYLAIATDEEVPQIIDCDKYHYILKLRDRAYRLFPHNENDKHTVENLLYRVIELHNYRHLEDLIWTRNKSQRIFCENETELLASEAEVLLYSGYRLSVEFLPDKRIGLILDSTTTLVDYDTLNDRLKKLGRERFEKEYNGEYVIFTNEKGVKKPRYFVKIRETYDIDSFKVEHYGKQISLRERFSNINPVRNKPFDEKEPVAEIKYFEKYEGNSDFVPLSTLQYSPDLEDLKETEDTKLLSAEIYANPQSKYEKIIKYLSYYNEIEVGKYITPIKLHFTKENYVSNLKEFDFPSLRFGDNHALDLIDWNTKRNWKYIKRDNLRKYGYYKQPSLDRILIIHHFHLNKNIVETFREELVKVINEWMLEYNVEDLDVIPIDNIQELDRFISHIKEEHPEIRYGAVLILNERMIKYDELKDCLNKYQVPSQGIKEWNCNKDNFDDEKLYHSILENTVAGLIGKCGGIPWILNNKLSADFYLGLDSGGPEKQRSWSCAYVFDGYGEKIHQREAEYYGKEGLPSSIFKKLIIESIEEKFERTKQQVQNLIIHRDGFLPKEEKKGLEAAINELRLHDVLTPDFYCVVVNIRKTSNFRIFSEINGKIRNPIIGTYKILDDRRAILVNTGFPVLAQSTAKPLLIEALSICGEYNIVNIVKDIFYLSELNWGSPTTGFKMPITIYYAEKMIEFARFKHKPTYLPL